LNFQYKNISGPHQHQPVIQSGAKLDVAKAVMIMVHGRGATAEDILSLSVEFNIDGVAYLAPQAKNNSWYPYSFLSPIEKNEPGLSSGLAVIDSIIKMLHQKGFKSEQIYLLGFSQGACLSLEYAARNPQKFGGIFGLSGGVIGESVSLDNYSGNLEGTEVFLGCSDIDPHIPLKRVNETEEIFKKLNANVTKRISEGMGHTVSKDETDFIKLMIKRQSSTTR
jgi:phospholipase/carboxylesterase